MRVIAKFSVGGSPVYLDEDLGSVRMSQRDRFALLKDRTDKQGNVYKKTMLNGERVNLPELIEASAPTVIALLQAVEQDEVRLRGPVTRNSHERIYRRMNPVTGVYEHVTKDVKDIRTPGDRKI